MNVEVNFENRYQVKDTTQIGTVKVVMLKGEKGDTGASGDYTVLLNKPKINGEVLDGDKTASQLHLASAEEMSSLSSLVDQKADASTVSELSELVDQKASVDAVNAHFPVAITEGGTGATDAEGARSNLGAVNKAGDTMTGRLNAKNLNVYNGSWPGIGFALSEDPNTSLVSLNYDDGGKKFTFINNSRDGTNTNEAYTLPAPTNTDGGYHIYNILTSKSPITVAQGGTGMSAPISGTITWASGITTAEMTLYKYGRIAVLNGRITLASQINAYGTLGTLPSGFVPAASVFNFLIETLDGAFYAAYTGSANGSIRNRVAMPAQGYIINIIYVTNA